MIAGVKECEHGRGGVYLSLSLSFSLCLNLSLCICRFFCRQMILSVYSRQSRKTAERKMKLNNQGIQKKALKFSF